MSHVYNETCHDLYQKGGAVKANLPLYEDDLDGYLLSGLTYRMAKSAAEMRQAFNYGRMMRDFSEPDMGSVHERACSIFVVYLAQYSPAVTFGQEDSVMVSKLTFVDMPGAERLAMEPELLRLREGSTLNKSLLGYASTVGTLARDGSPQFLLRLGYAPTVGTLARDGSPQFLLRLGYASTVGTLARDGSPQFVNYEECVLTRLLADALGGNSLCLSVGTLKQGDWDGSVTTLQHLQGDWDGSVTTLQHLQLARKVKNFPIINHGRARGLLQNLRRRLLSLLDDRDTLREQINEVTIYSYLPGGLCYFELRAVGRARELLQNLRRRLLSLLDDRDTLREQIYEAALSGAWDSSQLRRPAVRREFNLQLSDRFGLLEAVPPEGADAQAEYDAMAAAIREVATNHLAPRGSRRRRGWHFTLSQRTLRLMDARQRAHTAWLRSKSAAAKRERNRANRAADAAVQRDRERWIGQQVAEAQDMLRKKNLRQFARACDRLAGRSRSHQIPPAMRDVSGALHSGPDGVLKAMTESFDKLYGGETKLSDETLNQLENDVAAFELTRATEVDEAHGRPPDLAETEACVPADGDPNAIAVSIARLRDIEAQLIAERQEKAAINEDKQALAARLRKLQDAEGGDLQERAELHEALIKSEEMRLELAKSLIDAQMDMNDADRTHADDKLELEKRLIELEAGGMQDSVKGDEYALLEQQRDALNTELLDTQASCYLAFRDELVRREKELEQLRREIEAQQEQIRKLNQELNLIGGGGGDDDDKEWAMPAEDEGGEGETVEARRRKLFMQLKLKNREIAELRSSMKEGQKELDKARNRRNMTQSGVDEMREAYRRKLEACMRDIGDMSRAVAIMQDDPKTGLKVTPEDLFKTFQKLTDENLAITADREREMRDDLDDLHGRHVELKRKFRTLYLGYRQFSIPSGLSPTAIRR
ncbi:hypothetical protein FOA52_003683 [Chlamydomonas sp. UWO 241]|nr:hypothetical protein FOA52_003683 [Chlamydomonas sp. UWO 241]